MRAISLGANHAEEALRVVRALGTHRYVAGRLHLVHVFALAAVPDNVAELLAPAHAWAKATLADARIDLASRDEALWRRCTDAELVAVLDAFWTPGPRAEAARQALRSALVRHGLAPGEHPAFDEAHEEEIHPLLVDAGWELLPLAQLDAERHKGAMGAFGSALAFESARFEEETAIPPPATLYELPALGPVELLHGTDDDGTLAAPLVAWAQGNETYLDYVVRGVRRAAKIPEIDSADD